MIFTFSEYVLTKLAIKAICWDVNEKTKKNCPRCTHTFHAGSHSRCHGFLFDTSSSSLAELINESQEETKVKKVRETEKKNENSRKLFNAEMYLRDKPIEVLFILN